jgi:hypothetical protein
MRCLILRCFTIAAAHSLLACTTICKRRRHSSRLRQRQAWRLPALLGAATAQKARSAALFAGKTCNGARLWQTLARCCGDAGGRLREERIRAGVARLCITARWHQAPRRFAALLAGAMTLAAVCRAGETTRLLP